MDDVNAIVDAQSALRSASFEERRIILRCWNAWALGWTSESVERNGLIIWNETGLQMYLVGDSCIE